MDSSLVMNRVWLLFAALAVSAVLITPWILVALWLFVIYNLIDWR